MTQHYRSAPHTVLMAALACVAMALRTVAAGGDALPDRLSPREFWRLADTLSEPDGSFRSDNLLSNEMVFARVLPHVAAVPPGGVYLGVGPEQNFTYLAAVRPKIAFIVDIRRGNLHAQLMYKALFDLARDRADFVARLFTKPRPAGLTAQSTPREIMDAYWHVPTGTRDEFRRNLEAVLDVLTRKYALPLSPDDRDGIEYVYHAFYWFGPGITWSSSASGASGGRATYKDLMVQTDAAGRYLSYLATEEQFAFVQDLQRRNLVVPVVGNFAGPKAIRAIGEYVRGRAATVSVFYVSNVEQYLRQDGLWTAFCENVASLPIDEDSVFIRPSGAGRRLTATFTSRLAGSMSPRVSAAGAVPPVMPILPETRACAAGASGPAGR